MRQRKCRITRDAYGIETIKIETIEHAKEHLFFHQAYDCSIGSSRKLYVYRGLPDNNFKLITSLQRVCKTNAGLEDVILDNFAKYAEMEEPQINDSIWRKMIIGQHHGLPTRLLDWSRSPLMALHFAMSEDDMNMLDQRDCVVWRIDVEALNRLLPEAYQETLRHSKQKVFSVSMLIHTCNTLAAYDQAMNGSSMVLLEPPTIDLRIANQYSFFSVVPRGIDCVEDILTLCPEAATRFVIDKNIRWAIRDMLDQSNISERLVYPGLDGIAQWLKRHYFVRDITALKIACMNLADLEADVIVNSSNPDLIMYSGVNKAIFHKAGDKEMEKACKKKVQEASRKQKPITQGDIIVTDAFDLKADYVYHAIGSQWDPCDEEGSVFAMKKLYQDILDMAMTSGCHSIGFPLIGAGNYGCPVKTAWQIALTACNDFINTHPDNPMRITICVIKAEEHMHGEAILASIKNQTQEICNDYAYVGDDIAYRGWMGTTVYDEWLLED